MFWYEDEVQRVEKEYEKLTYKPKTVLYGSSTFNHWEHVYEDLSALQPVNLGFGGSTLAACVWFFDRIMAPYEDISSFIVYAGDNDLGDDRHPEEVFIFYKELVAKVKERFGNIPITYISIKPSLNRWYLIDRIQFTNKIIEQEIEKDSNQHFIDIYPMMTDEDGYPLKELFQADGLHLSKKGYKLWKEILLTKTPAVV